MKSLIAALVLLPVAAWGQTTAPEDAKPFGTSCAYPEAARAAHHEGTTLLSYRGTDGGRIESVEVVHSSGFIDLDDAAVRCVAQWRFNPEVEKFNIGTRRGNIAWSIAANGTAEGKSIGLPHDCRPYYPEKEAKAGVEGTTTVGFTITETGRVNDPELVKLSGNANLDEAALQCVRHWRYRPAMKDGKPIAVSWKAEIMWKSVVPSIPAFAGPARDCLKSYPVKASDLTGIPGITELQFTIVRGGVKDVSVVASSGSKALDEAAESCIATRRYVREMIMVNGKEQDRFRTMTLRERIVWADALK